MVDPCVIKITHRPLILTHLGATNVHGEFAYYVVECFPSLPRPLVFVHGLREGEVAVFLRTLNHKGPSSSKSKRDIINITTLLAKWYRFCVFYNGAFKLQKGCKAPEKYHKMCLYSSYKFRDTFVHTLLNSNDRN